jgi:transposase InsO family protein
MSKNALIVMSVLEQKKSVTAVALEFGVTRQWVHELIRRYRILGADSFQPSSKRPQSNSRALTEQMHAEIFQLRQELLAKGLDAGAQSIQFYLIAKHTRAPALSTIWRSLREQGLVQHQPKKRPIAYRQRFEADQPNETWQSDFTHVKLANGQDIEVLNFLDDHSRLLLGCQAHYRVTARIVVADFMRLVTEFGAPYSTLTDNGLVFTARFRNGKNAFEYLLEGLGIEQKNSRPNHPQTQGKIERFHQTLKRWLAAQAKPRSIQELQVLLNQFQNLYNTERPHRAVNGQTPRQAYDARPKAKPNKGPIFGAARTRTDRVDSAGKVSLRRAGKQHHIGVGRAHAGKQVFLIIDSRRVMVTDLRSGEILSENQIEPTASYWPKLKAPENSLEL